MRAPRAVAFDLDGTLVDSRHDIAAACNHVLERAGRGALPPEVIAGFVGDGVRALVARAFGLPVDAAEVDPLAQEFVAYYEAHPVDRTTWIPGAEAALGELAPMPVALVTNKSRSITLALLKALGAGDRFAFVWAGGDGPLKPSPAGVHAIASALRLGAADLWVVGDGAQDVNAARAAGAVAVAVLGGFGREAATVREAHPDAVLGSVAELPALVRLARGAAG
jgi:phosphoglycolate phosphatase